MVGAAQGVVNRRSRGTAPPGPPPLPVTARGCPVVAGGGSGAGPRSPVHSGPVGMTRRANRLLHVAVCAPAAAILAVAVTPSSPARVSGFSGAPVHILPAAAAAPPSPAVVCLDPGHGGVPDNAHPEQPFDPGAVAANGLLEKDVALDLARRVRRLLQDDLVTVVMTRDRDVWLDIPTRSATCNRSGAAAMVSIHLNGFQDPSVGGSVVLYPHADQPQFAQTMSDALASRLAPYGIQDDGIVLRDNWWIHTTMPTVTVESAYLSNPREADLLRRDEVRQAIAAGIRDGIERQLPQIARRKAEILAWRRSHPAAPEVLHLAVPGSLRPPLAAGVGSELGQVVLVGLVLGAAVAAVVARRPLGLILAHAVAGALRRGASGSGRRARRAGLPPVEWVRPPRLGGGRRSRLARRRAALARARRPGHRRTIYDELPF